MNVKIAPRWKDLIGAEFEKPYFEQLAAFVKQEYATRQVFPAGKNIFRAFDKCDPDDLKVVIIGQDPLSRRRAGQRPVFLCKTTGCSFRRRWSIFSRR